jgi:molybdenum cofactor synthesis domain-containing protein
MIEKIRQDGDAAIISKEAQIGQHIRTMGEDFSLGALLLETSSEIRAEAIAALLSAGNASVWVKRFLRCLFIPTGSELVPAELKLKQGQLPETNSILFQHYVTRWGGSTSVHAIVRDHKSDLQTVLRKAIQEYDFIAIGSGTSKGRDDWTASLMQELGQVLVHGVAYHPGHPVLLGIVDGKPVIGIPGYPVAAWACLVQFVKPLLEKYYHIRRVQKTVQGILSQDIRSISGYREFVRVRLIMEGEELRVQPLPGGASRLSSLLHADGWIEIPEEAERLNKGETISVNMME